MKTKSEYSNLSIPEYALSYLVNRDNSGIDDDDKKVIDAYMSDYYAETNEVKGSLIFNVDGDEGYFTNYPEFGLPCNCYDCTILILVDDD